MHDKETAKATFQRRFRTDLDMMARSHLAEYGAIRRSVSLTMAEMEARLQPRVTKLSADTVEITWDRTHAKSTHSINALQRAARVGVDPSDSLSSEERHLRTAESFLVLEYALAMRNWIDSDADRLRDY